MIDLENCDRFRTLANSSIHAIQSESKEGPIERGTGKTNREKGEASVVAVG